MAVYQELYRSGELGGRVERARDILKNCHLCPRRCRADRLSGERGMCRIASEVVVSSYGPHFGEEAPLVGISGSGTIFFSYCNLRCMFCQNYSISQLGQGRVATKREIAKMMLALEERGCHNINLVTPTHVVPQILEALEIAVGLGLSIPLVYNCGGYESVETLELLDGIVDIYMPDMKYSNERNARRFSGVKDYPEANRAAVKEMHRQVGDLQIDERGVARRGLLIRHLVLPSGVAGTEGVVSFIAEEISRNTYLNVMAQYYPAHRAFKLPALSSPLRNEEFLEAVDIARGHGLERLDGARSMARQV
ncbi:MAG TPA: radical SAM protein [Dehalococcoidia bacterium]|nr:radical SAM protein [Dehalococcoidia bacterium]